MNKKRQSSVGVSRRGFLKAFGMGSAAALLPGNSLARERVSTASEGELATLLDLSKCIGCGECVAACRESNAVKFPEPVKPFPEMHPRGRAKPEDWSDKRERDDRLTPYNWLFLQTARGQYKGQDFEITLPRRCMHCQNPPCSHLCPFGAAAKQANGITRISARLCMGGAKCKAVCPWHIPQRQSGVGLYLHLMPRFAGNGVMYKCDRCYQRIDKGELPACISICPENVQTIGVRKDIVVQAKALAEEMNGFIYGLDENGGTNTLYVSPVPFEVLNESVDKGAGKPHLKPVADSMSDETTLAKATLLAPIAGVMAGLAGIGARLYSGYSNREKALPRSKKQGGTP
ncbi:4Fe-4S dicluster domain-containing protein [Pseudodesulfovibrio piezophilus]|uniref:4Fe-4S ferredoxin iron-sulfur binding domain protein n=1 Tax=Pseudodesulfovibrio piezophilus (strain DSM 21447 / JCM 15486 / C1TLV30) TaxID=1322246 RepID=M1WSM5_PSEP2|nr:4Fe-4S dicluster domain-containing protein [Pseudodesulfovibrio piezophilus]CCH50279.1 4Fe-4S ferredoxin iron-sulfur binding domain protein [Pseudodesulfovibrio piezophilus C1TLV30]